MVNYSGEISGSVEHIASISEETAAGMGQLSASIQQQSTANKSILLDAEDLFKQAESLLNVAKMFNIDGS